MGYYVSGNGVIQIVKENLDDAYRALVKLQDAPDDAKNGGLYQVDGKVRKWFSWLPEDLTTLADTKEFMERVGFTTIAGSGGDLALIAYDNKTGQEEVFAAAIAPYVESGGHFFWRGEDGAVWSWEFRDGKLFVLNGYVVYDQGQAVSVEESLLRSI